MVRRAAVRRALTYESSSYRQNSYRADTETTALDHLTGISLAICP